MNMITYIAFLRGRLVNDKVTFTIDSDDVRTANKKARQKVNEIVSGSELFSEVMELVRIDERSDRLYSNGMGQTFLVSDVKL